MARLQTAEDEPDRQGLQLRIGIETGEVLVDQARAAVQRDRFLTGDAVKTAARLEAAAAPGTFVVGPGTYSATRHVVEYEELPALELKGKAVRVVARRALALGARHGGERAALGLESPLVGRDMDLARLQELVRSTVEAGRPRLVTVVGSAGVGKSRLAWELEKYLEGVSERHLWRKGRCLAYAERDFGPIAEVLRADTGIADDDLDKAQGALHARLHQLGLEKDDEVRDAVAIALGVGEPRHRPRDELFAGWRRYLGAVAGTGPLVLLVEDIHWADAELLSFLTLLARWGEGPMVILCLARHELTETHPNWGAGLPHAETITLEPLAADASAALIDGLAKGGLPVPLRQRILELAEGNPLFAEEMVRMLIDEGGLRLADGEWQLARPVGDIEIPGSVQAVIAARLDALPRAEKVVAQDAAVIGRVFWDRLVAHLADADLASTSECIAELRAKDLVVSRPDSSLAGTGEYSFRHVLIRDVAYDSLPKRERARLHKQVALWAEARPAVRIDEFSELIADHLVAARAYEEELLSTGSHELRRTRELAFEAAQRAARRASSLGLISRACRWMRTAIDLADALDLDPREVARLADEDASWHGSLDSHPDHAAWLGPAVEDLEALP